MSPTELQSTALRVIRTLQKLQVPFHITGGLASSFYGEPRLTQDIDLVVRLNAVVGRALCAALQGEFLVDEGAALDAVRRGSLFQALDRTTFIKVDFHVGERIPGELRRSVLQPLFEDVEVPVVCKEDAIASKLLWASQGSDKSRHDVLGMMLDPGPLNLDQVRKTARALGCGDILAGIESEIRERFGTKG